MAKKKDTTASSSLLLVDRYNRVAATALGFVQVVLGLSSVVIGSICIIQLTALGFVGHGIWCGTLFMVSGLIAIVAGSKTTYKLIMVTTAASASAIVFAIVQVILASLGLYYNIDLGSEGSECSDCTDNVLYKYCTLWTTVECFDKSAYELSIILGSILVALGGLEISIAITSASLACACCLLPVNKVAPQPDPGPPTIVSNPRTAPPGTYDYESTKRPMYIEDDTGFDDKSEWNPTYSTR